MARKLKTISKEINKEVDGFSAEVVKGYCNTDRKIAGTRLRWPGKGREGSRLIVRNADRNIVLDHNSAETYRMNGEVEDWLQKLKNVISSSGSKLRIKCPVCNTQLTSRIADKPFSQCRKCGVTYLGKREHYGTGLP